MTIEEQNEIILYWYPIIEEIGLSHQDRLPIHIIYDMIQDVTEWMIQKIRNNWYVFNYSYANSYIKQNIKLEFQKRYEKLQKQENTLYFSDTEIIYTDNAMFEDIYNRIVIYDLINNTLEFNRTLKYKEYFDRNLEILFQVYYQERTITEISKYHNVRHSRIQQIINNMLRHIRHICFKTIPREDKELFTPIGHYPHGYYDAYEYRKQKK